MRLRHALTLAVLLAAALTGAAQAQMIKRAEHGAVPLLAAAPLGLERGVVVKPGEVAWRESFRPAYVVRLAEGAGERVRPGRTAAVPAGTLLFAYQLAGGQAFCPVVDYKAPVPKVQCFRDLDGDGTFDAGYVTSLDGMKSQLIAGYVHGLAPMRKLPYRPAGLDDAPVVDGSVVYRGMKKGLHVFQVRVENESLDDLIPCEPVSESRCAIMGLELEIKSADGAAAIALLSVQSPRLFTVVVTGWL